MSKQPQVIAITGASSGIGAALAQYYAAPGRTLALIGRHEERLQQVAQSCRDKGAVAETGTADVRDRHAIGEWLLAFDSRAPIDLLVANAGILTGSLEDGSIESLDMSIVQIETNFIGALNTALPVLESDAGAQARSDRVYELACRVRVASRLAGLLREQGRVAGLCHLAARAAARQRCSHQHDLSGLGHGTDQRSVRDVAADGNEAGSGRESHRARSCA